MLIENLTPTEYETLLRQDFSTFAARCFYHLNPQTEFAMNWHAEVCDGPGCLDSFWGGTS